MKAPLSASQSVGPNHFFSKITDMIFLKFHVKLWFLKDKRVRKPEKNLIWGKKPEMLLNVGFFWSWQKIYSMDVLFLGLHDAP